MRLGIFYSDYKTGADIIDTFQAEKLGIIFVGNGIYHATVKDGGKASPVLGKAAEFFALAEDFESRGFKSENLAPNVKTVTYDDIVDLIFNDYDKIIWV